MNRLVALLREIKKVRKDLALHSAEPIKNMSMGDGYPISRWCNDGDSREEWRFLRALENRAPFGEGLDELGEPSLRVEYRIQGTEARGLGWAHLADGLAISFDHFDAWHLDRVLLTRAVVQENEQGEVGMQEDSAEVFHAALLPHVETHRAWITQACRRAARDPAELWRRRAELFPNLEFLPRVEKQISGLHPSHPWFGAIAQRLQELDAAVGEWNPNTKSEPTWRSAVTPEAQQRSLLCFFEDLDGQERCFDLHARFTPGAGRLHFRLDGSRRRAIVAHAGMKLGV